ncbi:fluoride efflux transporter CrcB [Salinarimonas soli]|uniref:Fluoride-specific ion channel FluC n=1 Tax=Salinarimonas soli TaxID=1638099 RepID=A0A5B2VZD8_9HYPH|nr:fluoride efflux transporter CrcB [Salinarimonas soli]KAA2244164.1 fluoride efflux transporter CrcB [Salinarimonas soli]
MNVLLVFLGAGLGGVIRYGVNLGALRLLGPGFPWATLGVNVVGSLAMGLLAAMLAGRSGEARLLLMTGMLGGFTTFSAFSLDAWGLWERGDAALALAYVAASVLLSVAALGIGLMLGRALA